MKFLLTIALAFGLSNAAYSACSASSPQDCTEESECLKLNEAASGPKFDFGKERKVKCMTVSTTASDDCKKIADGARATAAEKGTGSDAGKPSAAGAKQQ